MCKKVSHDDLPSAMIAIRRQPMKNLKPYKCDKCGKWHLATNRKGNFHFQNFIDRVRNDDRRRYG